MTLLEEDEEKTTKNKYTFSLDNPLSNHNQGSITVFLF